MHLRLISFNEWTIFVESLQRQAKMSTALALLRLSLFAVTVIELSSSQDACSQYEQDLSQLQADVAELKTAIIHPPKTGKTRMWANAQRDGRPAEYRWRPLFNAAKFG